MSSTAAAGTACVKEDTCMSPPPNASLSRSPAEAEKDLPGSLTSAELADSALDHLLLTCCAIDEASLPAADLPGGITLRAWTSEMLGEDSRQPEDDRLRCEKRLNSLRKTVLSLYELWWKTSAWCISGQQAR